MKIFPLALYGFLALILGFVSLTITSSFTLISNILNYENFFYRNHLGFALSLIILGIFFILVDIKFLTDKRRNYLNKFEEEKADGQVSVFLTAYNDENSVNLVVKDFLKLETVKRVVLIDNDSKDSTYQQAAAAGATVVIEKNRGYGAAVYRCLLEASKYSDTPFIAVCEGDGTFDARDIYKLLTYAKHAHVVNGTRIVEQLREVDTQLSNFMYFGNFFAAKILQLKYLGKGTYTDLGTTFKLIHQNKIKQILALVDRNINLEFNAFFMDKIVESDLRIIECPITFKRRIGQSKGGNRNNLVAMKVGVRMLFGIILDWKFFNKQRLGVN